jgi:hypothetical protein
MDRKGKISEIKHFTEKIFKTIESAQQDAVLSDAELDELLSYTSSITNRIISLRDDYKNEKINLLQEKLEELNNQIHSVFDELESVKSLKIQSRETFTAPQVESIIPEDLRDEIFDMTDVFSSEDELSESNVANEVKSIVEDEVKSIVEDEVKVVADFNKVENTIIEEQLIGEKTIEEPKTEIFAKPVVVELFDNQTNDIQKILLEEDGEDEDNLSLYDRLKENTPEWLTDYPGSKISDIWAGISLNDRICFIKDLFNEDQEQFKISIMRLNEMTSMDEVLEYTRTAFPYWDEESPTLYRFYMIIRRKIDV